MKLLTFLILILGFIPCIHSQGFPFPQENAVWLSKHVSNYCIGGSNITFVWEHSLGGDTLIQDNMYKKLIFHPLCIYANSGSNCEGFFEETSGEPIVIGGLREEDMKVFFYKFDLHDSIFDSHDKRIADIPSLTDILLYDFDWQVSDTVYMPLENGESLSFVVRLVTEEEGRKRIGLQNLIGINWGVNVIEGIGSQYGLFGLYYNPTASSYLPSYVCFTHNGEMLHGEPPCNTCILVGIKDFQIPPLKLFPNPTHDMIYFESDPSAGPFLLRIYNQAGELLYYNSSFPGNTYLYTNSFNAYGWIQILQTDLKGQTWIGRVFVTQ